MGFLSSLFGNKTSSAPVISVPPNPADEVKRQIETTEGELHEAEEQLTHATDTGIKTSLELLVIRKTQALKDLEEKLKSLAQ